MKIGIDIRTLMDKSYSGISVYTSNLLQEILYLDHENEYILFYNSFSDISSRLPDFKQANVKIVRTRYPNKIFNYLLQKTLHYPKIDKLLGGVDVFFSPHINFTVLSKDTKRILTIHDLSFLRYKEFFSCRKNIWHRAINLKRLVKESNIVVAISENTKRDVRDLLSFSSSRIETIYSGFSSNYRKIDGNDQNLLGVREKYTLPEKYILYLGTIEPRKNVQGIIQAYNIFRDNNQELGDIKLVLAGGLGWKHKSIIEEYEKSKYGKDIRFLGYIKESDKVYLYNLALVFLFPSFYEGFGFPPLEAMACGLPVITSISSSLPEVVGDSALLVDPYKTNEIAKCLETILTNDSLRDSLITRGYQRASNFSWTKTAKRYLELFSNTK